jgi:hypothetical protein
MWWRKVCLRESYDEHRPLIEVLSSSIERWGNLQNIFRVGRIRGIR